MTLTHGRTRRRWLENLVLVTFIVLTVAAFLLILAALIVLMLAL